MNRLKELLRAKLHELGVEDDRVKAILQNPHFEMPAVLTTSEGPGHTVGLAPRGVNSGNGFLFVSHRGEVFPSGFLPVRAGSIRETTLARIYRDTPLFRALRDPDALAGRCGRCEFRQICGGSRSRAYALTADPFATDPWCCYRPAPSRL